MNSIFNISKIYWLAFALLILLLAGCDHEPTSMESGKETGGTYISLHFSQLGRSRTLDSELPGSEIETEIKNVQILFFDTDDNKAVINESISEDDITWNYEGKGYGYTDPIKLKTTLLDGNYWIYVVANGESSIALQTSSYADFVGSYTSDNVSDIYSTEFLMVNKQDAITEGNTSNGGVFFSMQQGIGDIHHPVQVLVDVERLAVKIAPNADSFDASSIIETDLRGGGKIADFVIEDFALANCVNQFNLIQQWRKGENYTSDSDKDMLLITPSSATSYSIASGYERQMKDLKDSDFVPITNSLYCLENNSPYYLEELGITDSNALPYTKMKGRTTAVIFRAKATLSDGETFYRYNDTLYGDLGVLLAENILGLSPDASTVDLRNQGIEVFENGYVYYTYWIKDTNYTDRNEEYYAVMRNTWYKLKITGVNGIGSDVPGGESYNEEDPIDQENSIPQDVKIIIKLRVNAWKDGGHNDVELGEDDVFTRAIQCSKHFD